jgi:hypothetical protein
VTHGCVDDMMTIRRLDIGAGNKYLLKYIAIGDGPEMTNESDLARHCSESGTSPGSSSAPDSPVSTVWRLHQGKLHPFRLSRWRFATSRHVVILNRARAMSNGACRTIDSWGIFALAARTGRAALVEQYHMIGTYF